MAPSICSSSASQSNFLHPSQMKFDDHFTSNLDCSSILVMVLSAKRTRPEIAQALVKACEEYGFFKVVIHGVQQDLIDSMEAEAKKLFAFPLCEKERAGPADPYGYGNKSIGCNGDVGWIEYLLLRCDIQHVQQGYRAISPHSYLNFW